MTSGEFDDFLKNAFTVVSVMKAAGLDDAGLDGGEAAAADVEKAALDPVVQLRLTAMGLADEYESAVEKVFGGVDSYCEVARPGSK